MSAPRSVTIRIASLSLSAWMSRTWIIRPSAWRVIARYDRLGLGLSLKDAGSASDNTFSLSQIHVNRQVRAATVGSFRQI